MNEKYRAILHLPHPTSTRHARMAAADRAAQFSPFAALTGYEAAVRETARTTDSRRELDEDAKAALDETLRYILAQPAPGPLVEVEYFLPDPRKAGGSYRTDAGHLVRLDVYKRRLLLTGGLAVPLEDVAGLRCLEENEEAP